MGNIAGDNSANKAILIFVTVDPAIVGTVAARGSIATDEDGNLWRKFGVADTDWILTANSNQILESKSGIEPAASFVLSPALRKATITFATAFPSANYAITVTGEDSRNWTYESKLAGSFIINTEAAAALTGDVDWQAIFVGESA